jgi:inhibitor of KinA sporulation pathway (predicted exonuclease)
LNEILQIGAVRVDRLGGRILDTFAVCIRPSVHKRYSPPVKELPDLAACEASELDFAAAADAFAQWCGDETEFGTWGASDWTVLLQNFHYWKRSTTLPPTFFDLQAAFAASLGTTSQIALYRAVEYCQIPDVFDYHDPLYDALYTALVCETLDAETLAAAVKTPAQPSHRKATAGLPKRGKPWFGPFEGLTQMLNNRGCRAAVCPQCGTRVRVSRWYYADEKAFYAKFSCPTHGSYLLRLDPAHDRRHRLWASVTILEWDDATHSLFRAAKQANEYACTHNAAHRSRPRRRRRKPRKQTEQ